MKNYLITIIGLLLLTLLFTAESCGGTDVKESLQQEKLLAEASAQIGMPSIKNFREKKILKDILELRDQDGLVTYTYLFSEMTGKYTYLGESIGYGIPAATQFTNPQKWVTQTIILPQADPNGLFSPTSAEGTWVLLRDGDKVRPQYIESRISVFTYKLSDKLVAVGY